MLVNIKIKKNPCTWNQNYDKNVYHLRNVRDIFLSIFIKVPSSIFHVVVLCIHSSPRTMILSSSSRFFMSRPCLQRKYNGVIWKVKNLLLVKNMTRNVARGMKTELSLDLSSLTIQKYLTTASNNPTACCARYVNDTRIFWNQQDLTKTIILWYMWSHCCNSMHQSESMCRKSNGCRTVQTAWVTQYMPLSHWLLSVGW